MKNVQVINLGETRQLLAELDKARSAILAGHLAGFHAGFQRTSGEETLYLGGVYQRDPTSAVKGILKAAAAEARARAVRADPMEENPVFWQTMS